MLSSFEVATSTRKGTQVPGDRAPAAQPEPGPKTPTDPKQASLSTATVDSAVENSEKTIQTWLQPWVSTHCPSNRHCAAHGGIPISGSVPHAEDVHPLGLRVGLRAVDRPQPGALWQRDPLPLEGAAAVQNLSPVLAASTQAAEANDGDRMRRVPAILLVGAS